MPGLRPARCYRRLKRPYTRQAVHVPKRGYVKGVPASKIAQFETGTQREYENRLLLVSKRALQIRHNALEAARVTIVQTMEKNIGKGSEFFVKLLVYPHHVLRENALATGAGADRFQQGMRQSFGKPIGTAAQVRVGQGIFELRVNSNDISLAKLAMKKASYKLPTPCKVVVK